MRNESKEIFIPGPCGRIQAKYIKSKQIDTEHINSVNPVNTGLRIFDIYNMLKYTYDTKDLLKLLRARKLLLNKCNNSSNTNDKKIMNLSHRCDKVSIQMISILLNKMFPDSLNTEFCSKKKKESCKSN